VQRRAVAEGAAWPAFFDAVRERGRLGAEEGEERCTGLAASERADDRIWSLMPDACAVAECSGAMLSQGFAGSRKRACHTGAFSIPGRRGREAQLRAFTYLCAPLGITDTVGASSRRLGDAMRVSRTTAFAHAMASAAAASSCPRTWPTCAARKVSTFDVKVAPPAFLLRSLYFKARCQDASSAARGQVCLAHGGAMLNNAKGGRGQRAPFRVHMWLAFERLRKKDAELFDGVAGGSSEGCTARGDERPAKTSTAFWASTGRPPSRISKRPTSPRPRSCTR